MFSSLFGKRRSSPVEDETPPIPGPRSDEGFEIVDPTSPRPGLYPNVSGVGGHAVPYPQRPAPPAPVPAFRPTVDQTFHYLQGVPFALSKELQMATNKDSFATEIGDLLAFLTTKLNMSGYNYEFNLEKSVLKEC
ncbi:uncharacterized protein LOC126372197 [Pectinophora gossypiella]|uniref:UMA domain-containing protein n=1 Tax=Pectinophora gossypiella TaxID=13191 RepID=A0A1E1WBS9_PECGO|nr:uncharacterized protein LOC126372197 [Pectinophora gossypiella]